MAESSTSRPEVRIFYRIVRANSPGLVDFLSNEAMGVHVGGDDPEARRLRQEISVNATEAQGEELTARALAA